MFNPRPTKKDSKAIQVATDNLSGEQMPWGVKIFFITEMPDRLAR
jgi:hypothetical protein